MRSITDFKLTLRLFTADGEKCFGPGIARLLSLIDACGSLRAAAADMEMAYSKAWGIIKNCESALDMRLITSTVGGRHGGGASLTNEGRALLSSYTALEKELAKNTGELMANLFAEDPSAPRVE